MFQQWIKGKKTYIVAGVFVVGGILQAFGVPIPAVVYPILAGLGLGSLRAGVNTTTAVIKGAMKNAR